LDTDKFGVKMQYKTKSNGDEWFMDMDNFEEDNRIKISADNVDKEKNGAYWNGSPDTSMNPDSFRVTVFNESGEREATWDHGLAAQRGFMASPEDWRNVEITGYFRINSTRNRSEEITMYSRGGRHSGGSDRQRCRGTAYKPGIQYDGKPNFLKEYWHSNGAWHNDADEFKEMQGGPGNIIEKWIGQKVCVYDIKENGGDHVKIEVYYDLVGKDDFDKPPNNWKNYFTLIDNGNNMGQIDQRMARECKSRNRREIFSWGGPVVTFRMDDARSIDFKWLSVREIEPHQSKK
jgi:hypothetical protein